MLLSKRPLPWDDFMANLRTGDIVLMHGLFKSSIAIELFEDSRWSHSAIAVRAADFGPIPGVDPSEVLLWESNLGEVVVDVLDDKVKDGPQLVRLSQRISFNMSKKYDGAFASRGLLPGSAPPSIPILKQVIDKIHGDHFPPIPEGELAGFTDGRMWNKPVTDNTYFCSQLVAHTYKAWGLLTQAYVDNSYAPVDFSSSLDVSLLSGAWLGAENTLDTATIPTP